MVRLIHRSTGGDMWVSDDRLDEYLRAGHKLPEPEKEVKPVKGFAPPEEKKPRRANRR